MSQHCFKSQTATGRAVEVLIGYDRPLNGFFLVVSEAGAAEETDVDVFIYSNLSDVELLDLGGLTLDLEHFKRKLNLLGIALPSPIEAELQEDRRRRVGNRFRLYNGVGQLLSDLGV